MTDPTTTVDILSLEAFRATLDTRLTEAEGLLSDLKTKVEVSPALGAFTDATETRSNYGNRRSAHVERVDRLVASIRMARDATDTIIRNYRTTEARNNANASDIASVLGGVAAALNGDRNV